VSQQLSYEQFLAAEVRRRGETDYRFSYWSYLGWTILTGGIYGHYGTYKLVERRTQHARRRLAFMSYFWHTLNQRAEAAGKREEVAEASTICPGSINRSKDSSYGTNASRSCGCCSASC
jgi:hypothetical protein